MAMKLADMDYLGRAILISERLNRARLFSKADMATAVELSVIGIIGALFGWQPSFLFAVLFVFASALGNRLIAAVWSHALDETIKQELARSEPRTNPVNYV
jgi:hypothetical protein